MSDADVWRLWVEAKRLDAPNWEPPTFHDPRLIKSVNRCRFAFRVIRVIDPGNCLIEFGGETLWLEATLPGIAGGRSYRLDGLFKPTGTRRYKTFWGGSKAVRAFRYGGEAPELPDPERPNPPEPEKK